MHFRSILVVASCLPKNQVSLGSALKGFKIATVIFKDNLNVQIIYSDKTWHSTLSSDEFLERV